LDAEPIRVIGVEHEYRVLDLDGNQVDFRELITTLSIPGGGLDPGDPNAHHLPCGVLLTADGKEAEVATPPVPVGPDCLRQASAWSELAEDQLLRVLPEGYGIEGFSTHLNVAVRGDVVEVARRFALRFALPMSLLVDHADSPGLLVRPRRGRLELGGDFIEGAQLRVALHFALAASIACEQADLPAVEPPRLVRAKDRRGGFFAHRDAPADAMETAWAQVRPYATEVDGELGGSPLPRDGLSGQDRFALVLTSPFADVTSRADVVAMTWAAVAFRFAPDHHVVVPRAALTLYLEGGDAPGTREVRGAFDPTSLVPTEPHVPGPWWREHRAELVGVAVGVASVSAYYLAFAR